MSAFDPVAWRDFFVGSMGASAALTGLLFVAISINLEQILEISQPSGPGGWESGDLGGRSRGGLLWAGSRAEPWSPRHGDRRGRRCGDAAIGLGHSSQARRG